MAIIIVGETGVGKSTVGAILAKKMNFSMYEIGHVVKQTFYDNLLKQEQGKKLETAVTSVDELFKKNTKDYFTRRRLDFVSKIVSKEGNDYFVRRLLEMHDAENIIIIGARSDEELDTIKAKLQYPFVVALTCEDAKQENRFVNRENKFMDSHVAEKIFTRRIDVEKTWGVDTILGRCDMVVSTTCLYPEAIADLIMLEYDQYMYKNSFLKGINDNGPKLIL